MSLIQKCIKISVLGLVGSMVLLACDKKDQTPCNDPAAQNYNPRATVNDGSCQYPTYTYNPILMTTLDPQLRETSGLLFYGGQIWTHNDKGDKNEIYSLHPSNGSVLITLELEGADNKDWEDMAESETTIYVGDMGNNDGDRKNLAIYHFPKTDIDLARVAQTVIPQKITFDYENQTDFSIRQEHNYDCEAIIHFKENIYLFTKNRLNRESNLYFIPAKTGHHKAKKIATFNTAARITSASINPAGDQVILVGRSKSEEIILWILEDFEGDNFFSGNKTFVNLGPYIEIGQAEGITFSDEKTLLLTSEETEEKPAKLYKVELDKVR